tara:strand:- start:2941 stop:5049 length:2109 start_codon:yes stop_codon:yes gene_type:complete
MGNALEAAKFSVLQGNTGVANKKTTLAAIDTGMADVKAWKDSIDAERLKLKTDTADRFREAEKDANDKIEGLDPSNKTERDIIINGLADYKDRLYGNMNMVKAGMIKPEDNIIFQANGKQSFEIMSTNVKNIAAENKLTLERAKGGYWPDEEGGADVFHDPKSMGFEAALQRIQSTLTNPEFTKVKFGEDGMGTVEFYETQVNEATKIRELKRDKDGKPIPLPGKSGISLLAFQQGRNQRADYFNLKTQTEKLTNSDSALGRSFDVFMKDPQNKMYGNIETYQANNPQVKELIEDAIGVATNTVERSMSILSDNGPRAERSEIMTPAEWASATKQGIDLNEKISYSYVDANGKTQTGSKFKYVEIVVGANNQIVPKWRDGDLDAAEKSAGSSIYAALSRKLKGGSKRSEFDPNSSGAYNNKVIKDDKIGRVELSKRMASGGSSQTSALAEMKASGLYTVEKGFNEILSSSKVQELEGELDSKGKPRKGEIYKVQTPRGVEERIVYHTDEDGKQVSLQERTQQTLGLIMTNPTETKDLFNTYVGAGNNFDETYDAGNFLGNTVSTGSQAKLSMDTVVEGTGTKAVTLSNRITDVIKTADDNSYVGVDEDLLVKGIKGALNEALNQSNQKIDNLDVTYDDDDITITGVNSKGKTITITGSQESDDKEEMKLEVNAILNQFFQALTSDKDITAGGAGEGVNYKDK